jgi:hypothetical protein
MESMHWKMPAEPVESLALCAARLVRYALAWIRRTA